MSNSTPVEYVLKDKGCSFLGFPNERPWSGQMPHGAVIHSAPAIRAYSDANLTKSGSVALQMGGNALTGGVFSSNLDFIKESAAERGPLENPFARPILRGQIFDSIDQTLIYGGWHLKHFGHFLVETLGWLWVHEILGPSETVFSTPYGWGPSVPEQAILDLLEVQPAAGIQGKNLQVSRLLIGDPLIVPRRHVYDYLGEFARRLGSKLVANEPTDKMRPVYISRKTVSNPTSYISNEEALEDMFCSLGFEAVSPQDLSFGEQVNLLNRAPVIAGPIGSFFHASMFSTKPHQRLYLSGPVVNGNFLLTDAVSEGRSTYLNCLRKNGDKEGRPVFEADLEAIRATIPDLIA